MPGNEQKISKQQGANEAEQLSSLNAQTARGKPTGQRFRRKMEASIEAAARKRRRREAPASAAWKP